jgi:energy-coupling factor transporter ATP-binding protein EcfA2
MKITRIELQNFRAFDEPFELDLDGGKNLLLHGENGSGKSSIYFALKRFFEERGDDIAQHANHFVTNNRDGLVRIHLQGIDSTGNQIDQDFDWTPTTGHPLAIPQSPATAAITPGVRSMLVDGARRAGFLDYRAMLRTHLVSAPLSRSNRGPQYQNAIYDADSFGLEAQLFDLVSLVVLSGVRVPTGVGGETTIGTLMRQVWGRRPTSRHWYRLDPANEAANAFNRAFNGILPQLLNKVGEFLNYFGNHGLSIKFREVALAWDKPSLQLKGAELIPDITFRDVPIQNHNLFLNEARLSALSICLFLAGVYLCDNDYAARSYLRFLFLDDALIGLDLQNRIPVLRILSSDTFKNFQIFLYTYDQAWFELAKGYLPTANGWLHLDLIADDSSGKLIPRQKSSETDLVKARRHLAEGDLPAAAVHARAAFEWKLRNVCENRAIKVKFKKDIKEVTADDLWQAIKDRQVERVEHKKTHPNAPDFLPPQLADDVDAIRSTVLNQLSHAGTPGFVRDDVLTALTTIEAVHNWRFPKV